MPCARPVRRECRRCWGSLRLSPESLISLLRHLEITLDQNRHGDRLAILFRCFKAPLRNLLDSFRVKPGGERTVNPHVGSNATFVNDGVNDDCAFYPSFPRCFIVVERLGRFDMGRSDTGLLEGRRAERARDGYRKVTQLTTGWRFKNECLGIGVYVHFDLAVDVPPARPPGFCVLPQHDLAHRIDAQRPLQCSCRRKFCSRRSPDQRTFNIFPVLLGGTLSGENWRLEPRSQLRPLFEKRRAARSTPEFFLRVPIKRWGVGPFALGIANDYGRLQTTLLLEAGFDCRTLYQGEGGERPRGIRSLNFPLYSPLLDFLHCLSNFMQQSCRVIHLAKCRQRARSPKRKRPKQHPAQAATFWMRQVHTQNYIWLRERVRRPCRQPRPQPGGTRLLTLHTWRLARYHSRVLRMPCSKVNLGS